MAQLWDELDLNGDIWEIMDLTSYTYLLKNGTKRPPQVLSTVTTIRKVNANNNNNKPRQH